MKRMLSLILAVLVAVTLAPTVALAADANQMQYVTPLYIPWDTNPTASAKSISGFSLFFKTVQSSGVDKADITNLTVTCNGTKLKSPEIAEIQNALGAYKDKAYYILFKEEYTTPGSYIIGLAYKGVYIKMASAFNVTTTAPPAKVAVTSVALNKTTLSLRVGGSATLTPIVSPSNASNKSVMWKTSNARVASISAAGKVTAYGVGTATITAVTNNGGKTATCKVTVSKAGSVSAKSVRLNKKAARVRVGKTLTLRAKTTPLNTSPATIKWTTSNKKIATVSRKGVVKGVRRGSARITVSTWNGKKATCKVTVIR